jgi:hypothetical protein
MSSYTHKYNTRLTSGAIKKPKYSNTIIENNDVLDSIFKTINIPISFIRYEFPHVKDPEALDNMLRDCGFKIYLCPLGDGDKVAISNEYKEVG